MTSTYLPVLNWPIYSGWSAYTPVIPKVYWDVYSQEQRIKWLFCDTDKLHHYMDYLSTLTNTWGVEFTEQTENLIKDTIENLESDNQYIFNWVNENLPNIINVFIDNAIDTEANERISADEGINALIAALSASVSSNTQRIEQIIGLPEGSTTGDAILNDGKISSVGAEFTNVGENIRNTQKLIVDKNNLFLLNRFSSALASNSVTFRAINAQNFVLNGTAIAQGTLDVNTITIPNGCYELTFESDSAYIQLLDSDRNTLAVSNNFQRRLLKLDQDTQVTIRLVVPNASSFSNEIFSPEIKPLNVINNDRFFRDGFRNYILIKHHEYDMLSWPYWAFAWGCSINGNEIYAIRAGKQHTTPESRSDWGKIYFIKVLHPDNIIEFKELETDYTILPGELRDPNMSILPITNDIILSCFTTDNSGNTPINGNVIFDLTSDLQISSYATNVLDDNDFILWGATVKADSGKLIKCGYHNGIVKIFRSVDVYNGSMSGIQFETVATLEVDGSALTECTLNIFDEKLYCLIRSEETGAYLFECDDLEGENWKEPIELKYSGNPYILHSPVMLELHGKIMTIAGSRRTTIGGSNRPPVIAKVNIETGKVVFSTTLTYSGTYGGYPGLVKIAADEYGAISYTDHADGTNCIYQRVNIAMLDSGNAIH